MWRRLVVFAAATVGAGCHPVHMATPADLAPLADEIAVTNRGRSYGTFANETFGMGPYQVTRVHRGGTTSQSSGFMMAGFGHEHTKSHSFYDFDITTPVGAYKGSCGVFVDSQESHYGRWTVGGPGSQVLDCNCAGGGPGVTRVYVQLAPQVHGVLVHRDGTALGLEPSSLEGGGNASFMGSPIGFQSVGTPPIGAVEVVHPGRVWINRTLGAGEQSDLACLFGGLLLYHPPSTPP